MLYKQKEIDSQKLTFQDRLIFFYLDQLFYKLQYSLILKLPFQKILNLPCIVLCVLKSFLDLYKYPLEDIYKDQGNFLKHIEQYRVDLKSSEKAISESKNTIVYKTIGLNKKISDDPEMLAFVNQSLSTCKALKPQLKNIKTSKIDHSGHDH